MAKVCGQVRALARSSLLAASLILVPGRLLAQDITYPYQPTNPYPIVPPSDPAQSGQGSSVPWPYNPLGTPAAPFPSQTAPSSDIMRPGVPPSPNLLTPTANPWPKESTPWGQTTAPGFSPEPASDRPQTTMPTQNANEAANEAAAAIEGKAEEKKEGKEGSKEKKEEKSETGKEETAKGSEKKETDKDAGGEEENPEASKEQGTKKKGTSGTDKDNEDDKAAQKEKSALPPVTVYDPVREALFELNSGQYAQSLATLNKILASNPNQPQAHYVRAVVQVMLRQYGEAAKDYKEVMRLTPNSDLGRRASDGLKKISF